MGELTIDEAQTPCRTWTLHDAVDYGTHDLVLKCLGGGADPNGRVGYRGDTPLHVALGNVETAHSAWTSDNVKLLLERGADTAAHDHRGIPPLFLALNNTKVAIEIATGRPLIAPMVKMLLDYGADIEERCNGKTPLIFAVKEDVAEDVAVLLEHGADVHAKDGEGRRAIDYSGPRNLR